MAITKILVGTDFSPSAERAGVQALEIARKCGAELLLVHVCDVVERDADNPDLRQWGESVFRDRRAALLEASERLSDQGAVVSQAVHDGKPAAALCEVAAEVGADLVAVGAHGGGGAIERFLVGSVAERTLRLCDRTVLIARDKPSGEGFRKVLVPVDFSEISDRVVETALSLAADDASVELFHCWRLPPGLVDSWGAGESPLVGELRETRAATAEDNLGQLLLRHRKPGVELYFEHAESPSARDGVLARLEARGHDLVVLGSHGRRGLKRLLAGSVAEGVARGARCSVAVVK